MKHTTLKWEVTKTSPSHYGQDGMISVRAVNSPMNSNIAVIGTDDQAQANAEFIVRACNAHYKLLKACKKALAEIQDPKRGPTGPGYTDEVLKQAISQAEKEA